MNVQSLSESNKEEQKPDQRYRVRAQARGYIGNLRNLGKMDSASLFANRIETNFSFAAPPPLQAFKGLARALSSEPLQIPVSTASSNFITSFCNSHPALRRACSGIATVSKTIAERLNRPDVEPPPYNGKYLLYRGKHNVSVLPRANLPECARSGGPSYYHATQKDHLLKILRSGKVERRDASVYKGAFVSTKPETEYGRYTLAFNRSIEKAPVISGNFLENRQWAGFKQDIPVTVNTLEFIAVRSEGGESLAPEALRKLSREFSQAAGRKIEVRDFNDVNARAAKSAKSCGIAVPENWPTRLEYDLGGTD